MTYDFEMFRSMVKRQDLLVSYRYGKEALGYDERLDSAPTKVHISWKTAATNESVWSVDLSKNELVDVASRLTDLGIKVPDVIDQATIGFPAD